MKNKPTGDAVEQDRDPDRARGSLSDVTPDAFQCDKIGQDKYAERVANLEGRMSSTGRRMEYLTAAIAAITLIGSAIAYFQWDTSKRQFVRDQRPYVMSRIYPFPVAPDQPITITLRTGNYGKSPAIKQGVGAAIFFSANAINDADDWFKKEAPKIFVSRNETIIAPNVPASHEDANVNTLLSYKAVPAEMFNDLLASDFSIIMVARHVYFDTEGNQYWTDICMGRLASGAIVYCPKHNEIH